MWPCYKCRYSQYSLLSSSAAGLPLTLLDFERSLPSMTAIFATVAFSTLLATKGLAAPTNSSGGDVLWEMTNVAGTM